MSSLYFNRKQPVLHGYTFEKLGTFYTRITGFDKKVVAKMEKSYIRYDRGQISRNALFVFLSKNEYNSFYKQFDIIKLKTIEEFDLVSKMMY